MKKKKRKRVSWRPYLVSSQQFKPRATVGISSPPLLQINACEFPSRFHVTAAVRKQVQVSGGPFDYYNVSHAGHYISFPHELQQMHIGHIPCFTAACEHYHYLLSLQRNNALRQPTLCEPE